jgi:hypothetical protein
MVNSGSGDGALAHDFVVLPNRGRATGWAAWASRRQPVLTINGHVITDGRSGRVRLADRESAPRRFITTNANNPDEIAINLDSLSATWSEIAQSVEAACGYSVLTVCERG